MKKIFSFAMVLFVLVAALGFSVGSASARSITPHVPVLSLHPDNFDYYFTPGTQVEASIFVDSNSHDLYCVAKDDGRVACKFPKKFAEMDAIIYLTANNGEVLMFYVTLPKYTEVLIG